MSRAVQFEAIDGAEVFVVRTEPDRPTDRIVIMAHGFRGSSVGPARAFVDFERLLLEDGIAVVRFDQPGSGNSPGAFENSSFNRWVRTIEVLARSSLDDGRQVALLGQSMGATAVVAAVSKAPLRDRIRCLLLWAPDPKTAVGPFAEAMAEEGGQRYHTDFWIEAHDARFFDALAAFGGALHLVYGANEQLVAPRDREDVANAVERAGGRVLLLPGQPHSSWEHRFTQQVFAEQRVALSAAFAS
jgi:pimeloyl-ACP methyl ester carboxylesterase